MKQPLRHSASQHGFTLIELVIGSTVLCLALTLLFSALWFSVRSWDAAERRRDTVHTAALVQGTLAQQLRQTRPIFHLDNHDQRVIAFRGDTDRLSYIAPLSRRDSSLYLNTLFVAQTADGPRLHMRYVPWRPGIDLDNDIDTTADNTIELLTDIRELEIGYYGATATAPSAWHTRWSEPHALPERVHIRIIASDARMRDWPELTVCLDGGAECLIQAGERPITRIVNQGEQRHGG